MSSVSIPVENYFIFRCATKHMCTGPTLAVTLRQFTGADNGVVCNNVTNK